MSSSVLAVGLLGLPSQAATSGASATTTGSPARGNESDTRAPGYYDARVLSHDAATVAEKQMAGSRTKSENRYFTSLGRQAVVDFDPLTRTPRDLGRLDGFLTGRSGDSARSIALGYVRNHLATLGLTSSDLSTLRFRQDYVDAIGVHHLSWTQQVGGVNVFGNGLKVNVTGKGQVLSVQGSPISGLAQLAAKAPTAVRVTPAAARSAAAGNVEGKVARGTSVTSSRGGSTAETVWSNHDYAKKVWFLTPGGLRLGWSTYVQSGPDSAYQHVIDAGTGRVLFRRSTVDSADGDAYVYDNYPGAPKGGTAKVVNFIKKGWLRKSATFLNGSSVIAWSDVNDDNALQSTEKTPVPGTRKGAQFAVQFFPAKGNSRLCTRAYRCTWNPQVTGSWKTNRKADVTQAFYLASNFHDYLKSGPIAFTARAGNFEANGGDPVLLNALDGANTFNGMPDGNHIDNANMSTPPDGTPPTMQMYLWHFPGATDDQDPWVPTSSAFDASVEYHEYTHGLSNRLVVDADGNSTLNSIQAGSMGEAWSDYYAMDYLVTKGFVPDSKRNGEVLEGKYLTAGKFPFRTEAIDCSVGATAPFCTDINGDSGGYTYGDFPTIGGGPEVHSSGEVWAQTLWDIRKAFGHGVADTLITRAMSLSANDPSMLDMRNAIIQADLVKYGSSHSPALWKIFAKRGMGYFAGAVDGNDAYPAQSFKTPPSPATPHDGTIAGYVRDDNGQPVQGAVVTIGGFGDQYTQVTGANGFYEFDNLYVGTYRKVVATAPGYFGDAKPGTAYRIGSFTAADFTNFAVERDFAATTGSAEVIDFDGPDYTAYGCGPDQGFDTVLTTGWGSTTGDNAGTPTNTFIPKSVTVDMHTNVDIDHFSVDPSSTCGDGGSASVGDYKIETSPDGSTWTEVASGTFTKDNRGQLNDVAPNAPTTARYIRFTMLSNQTPDFATNCPNGAYSGCSFTDMTELAVFGAEAP